MKIFKLDRADQDNPTLTTIEAVSLPAAVEAEFQEYLEDDRLEPCHGTTNEEALSFDEDSIQWAPGDGGQYTIAVFAPDTEEGKKKIKEWLEE